MKRPAVWLAWLPALCTAASPTLAAGDADPLVGLARLDRLEFAPAGDRWQALEGEAWLGHDFDKLWLKADVEREEGATESASLEALYSRAVSPYWDIQAGWRHDFDFEPARQGPARRGQARDWLALGVQGLAPYRFEVDSTLYLGEGGRSALSVEAEYELLFSQRLILTPEVEVDVRGYSDEVTGVGSGLSTLEVGLRLRYEIRRELAPYVGVLWERRYGESADFARREGHATSDTRWVLGVRAWF